MLAEHGNISVGIDLGRDYSQIAFCSKSDRAPLMVMQSEEEKEENDYLIRTPVDLFSLVERKDARGVEVLYQFLKECFALLKGAGSVEHMTVMVTMHEAIRNAVDQAKTTKTIGDNKKETEKKNNDTSGTVTPQVTGKFPYKDGIYYGTGEGYMGDITVAVVIQNKTVTSILVTETDGDGEEFVKKAKAVADQIVKKQSTRKIDTVSGATYSSKGILEAIKDALNHAKEATNGKETEKPAETETQKPAETEKPSESESSSESEKERVYADGDYTASATCTSSGGGAFDDYTLTATVTIKDDKITAITNVAGSGAGYVAADALYIKRAAEGTRKVQGVVAQVLAKNSLDEIDVVSGATCSSNALLEACRQALESAKIVQQSE